ncbi:hypothetical protein AVO42_02970 [Thiomicrospira sp. XS5]|uniref:phosphoribosyltransferase-like protein n=1 Tax=Thiomicrospira sp. XS5 TaxID=1775636 RepID=UPI00074759D9|nr:hypothetical protein [Thiomicrospira sp. XS5]KUJ74387.1 hypothetical protein AVO42_02970 [Thiomicrospira sp. XS5]
MSQREQLLESIANTIQDYRDGSLPKPLADHVNQWVKQFDEDVQIPILEELDVVLKRTYFSKEKVIRFLNNVINTEKLTGSTPEEFWRSVNFLDIQSAGNSQKDMLDLFSQQLTSRFGFGVDSCGQSNEVFLYIDDGIFTGNRVRRDLDKWISEEAPHEASIHIVCIATHRGGRFYADTKIKECIGDSGKNIKIKWWTLINLEDRKSYVHVSDVLRPTVIPQDSAVQAYVGSMHYNPTLRPAGNCGGLGLFSSDQGKILLEQQFLKEGVRIKNMCQNLGDTQRPLGHMTLETLGFGSLIVTYRNCPNNAPLVFWVDDPWYPLFPRQTNTQTGYQRMFSAAPWSSRS